MILVHRRHVNEIPILEVVAEQFKSQPLPCVIYYHGWRSAKELVLTQARKLAQQKIRVILPDAFNHGERLLQQISQIPSFTFWQSIQANLAEFSLIIHYLKQNQLLLADLIGVGGVSMGGITTCALLTQHPEIKWAACVMGSPQPLLYRERVLQRAAYFKRALPADFRELTSWLSHYDLASRPQKLAGRPLLFWHGTADPRIDFEDAYQFYVKHHTQSYGRQMQFDIGRGQGHLVRPETMDRITTFMAAQIYEAED
ncbi:alpha/beta fold hydrolase [Lactobacillus sp. CC-MHH1034]|nr:prolyl oligopeptidase family serine peptidase [Agrilactobacillus fermenti]MCD2256137.1 alpha/beta fold hydrolase [Agrilactobacillus fermenti]